jgi:methanogenic corrinoid protein MtbC1
VRAGVLPARKSGRSYEVLDADVRELAARRAAGEPPPADIRVRDWAAQSDRLYDALVAGDETLARQRLSRLASGVPVVDLCERVIAPALWRIGEDWTAGRLTIAAEHRASMICERLLVLAAKQPQGRPRGVAIVATPPGERHGLPALMAAACLRQERWFVHHLACDLPVAEVTGMAQATGADLVVLSTTTAAAARTVGEQVLDIAAATGALVLAGQPGDSLHDLLRRVQTGVPERMSA